LALRRLAFAARLTAKLLPIVVPRESVLLFPSSEQQPANLGNIKSLEHILILTG
jgi:hypothetical protein